MGCRFSVGKLVLLIVAQPTAARLRRCRLPCAFQISLACKLILVPASALDTGHCALVSCAMVSNLAASKPGTLACVCRLMVVIAKPSPCFSSATDASVSIEVGFTPARPSAADSAIEKQPASAAPTISSGL